MKTFETRPMKTFETRLQNALDGLLQFIPETKQEATRMSAAQWAAFQDAANECATIQGELSGSIRQNGTWIQVGRYAAEQINNAAAHLAQQNFIPGFDPPTEAFQVAVENGIVSKKLLIEIARRYGLKETQEAVVGRLSAMERLRDELQAQVTFVNERVGVLFEEKTAKMLGVALPDPMCAETRSH